MAVHETDGHTNRHHFNLHIITSGRNRKMGRPKSTWKENSKKEINKTLSEDSTVAASKEKWKDLVRGLSST